MKLELMVLKNMLEHIKVERQYREELIDSALIYVDGMIEESDEKSETFYEYCLRDLKAEKEIKNV